MTTHDPILDRSKPPGCLASVFVLAAVTAFSVCFVVGAAALAVNLWRVLT
jgi:hypothetical protein